MGRVKRVAAIDCGTNSIRLLVADVDREAGTLAGLCRGEYDTDAERDDVTLFKSVGTALEDLAAAILVWQLAN